MDIEVLSSIIGSVGFPIGMCLIMFWYMNKERETHDSEVKSLIESLNNNTNVLIELKTLINSLINKE